MFPEIARPLGRRWRMKQMSLRQLLSLTCVLLCPLAAFALEESAQVRVTQLLKTTTSWDDAPIRYPTGKAEITALQIEIAPGGQTGWHEHPVPSFGYVLEGELEVTLASGAVKRLKAGEALAEVISTAHNGRSIGPKPLKLIVFYAGIAGEPLTLRRSPPSTAR
jgi:quercetin dioxygenase-like cupin family protein